jgi:putative ABC transport system permease protein
MSIENNHPPKWAKRLLEFFCRVDYVDEILGDIHEAFYWRMEEQGLFKARFKFILEVMKSLRPTNLKSFYHFELNTIIFRNYIKIAFRTLLKRKSTSLINILGLSVGVAAFVLIFLYSYQILSFDDHHENKDRIFLAYKERITPDGTQATYDTWVPMKDRLEEDYNQVVASARYYATDARVLKDNQFLEEEIVYTDESLFSIFTFPLAYGNERQIFQNQNSVVISSELARKYFQKENPIGESMEIFIPEEDTTLTFQVSSIVAPYPENISFQPQLIIQIESIPVYPEIATNWSSSFLETSVLLDQKESAPDLESMFPDLVESLWGEEVRVNTEFKLLPFENYYDEFIGSKSDAKALLLIGLGILLIAIINFMNLSTAQASQRAKEIGLRKVLGAFQGQLRTQFMTEAIITSLIATVVGVAIVFLSIESFNDYFDASISLSQFSISEISSFLLAFILLLGILSGSYPALYLSSIGAIEVLRHKLGFGGSMSFRNSLVIIQFTIALFLIASTLIIRNQILFMSERDMGFDSENIMVIEGSRNDFIDGESGITKLNTFKNELKTKSYVKEVALSRNYPTAWTNSFTFVRPEGWTGDPLRMRYTYVNTNFFSTYTIPLRSGSYFFPDAEGDQRTSVILNEAALRAFEFSADEQNVIQMGDRDFNVVGVVEDFHFESLELEVAPTIIMHRVAENPVHSFISIKMEMTDLAPKLEEIETMWNQLGSINEFRYAFVDDRIDHLYEAEQRFLGLVTMFSLISILVACLGLYGLTLFIIEKRRKEISIRKVLGSEISGILQLIFKDFTKWVAVSFVISVPFAIYFLNDWLLTYHYRISISWVTFVLALLIVLTLVIITVGYQSLKAASANPVKYLKDD